ncbi:uncharacterized protein LOC112520461 [Cynara cardunculus var. scolymus]|uniref:Uncharacterized protein n=1 Tax=Cynara cardunculus var. scolymus TaxID=59895 RepID=A0A103Y1X8_CYNCS|nr:uncharacterized protein LOC112520461 [Cynara cardunculus var. scolymus]KVI01019.1 Protein of unknown function DUF4228 [Cynara cardunculus var. scolymus]
MKNTIKCCISCILPCGSLDVVRIVHSNGRVEEISGTVYASDIMKAYPKHVLKKPSFPSYTDDGRVSCPEIVILPPDAELRRGKIYFLMPAPPLPPPPPPRSKIRKKKKEVVVVNNDNGGSLSDRYLTEILSEKVVSTQRDRKRGRAGVWRPHLESICEGTSDNS